MIFIEYGIPMKLERLIKMCLIETYSRDWAGKHLSDMFPIRNGLKQGDALSPLFLNFALENVITRVQTNQGGLKLNGNKLNVSKLYSGRNYDQTQSQGMLAIIRCRIFCLPVCYPKI
jgi:hypothetical protein